MLIINIATRSLKLLPCCIWISVISSNRHKALYLTLWQVSKTARQRQTVVRMANVRFRTQRLIAWLCKPGFFSNMTWVSTGDVLFKRSKYVLIVLDIKRNAIGKYISTEKYNFHAVAFSLSSTTRCHKACCVATKPVFYKWSTWGRWQLDSVYVISVHYILDICFALQWQWHWKRQRIEISRRKLITCQHCFFSAMIIKF